MSGDTDPSAEQPTPVPAVSRPAGITFVLVLVWIAAIVDLVAGIALFITSFTTTDDVAKDLLRYFALTAVIIGLLTAIVAVGLANGSQFSRVLTITVMALRLANAVWALVAIQSITLWPAVFDAALAVLVIALLTTRGASDYFRRR